MSTLHLTGLIWGQKDRLTLCERQRCAQLTVRAVWADKNVLNLRAQSALLIGEIQRAYPRPLAPSGRI